MPSHAAEIAVRKASRVALVVRWIVSTHIALLLLQLVTAIAGAAGFVAVLHTHGTNARFVAASGVLQAIGLLSAGPRAGWFVRTMAVVVAASEAVQLYLGLRAGIPTHVTLAMIVWALSVALFIRVWAPPWTRED
jgi:hypothetical protein